MRLAGKAAIASSYFDRMLQSAADRRHVRGVTLTRHLARGHERPGSV
jgi:hypothetical protein